MEIWMDAFNTPRYEVSNTGKIRRKRNGKELNAIITERGYRVIDAHFGKNPDTKKDIKKRKRIGKMVWETFNGCECKETIDHTDRNKLNDELSNLECVSYTENNTNRDIYSHQNKYGLDDNKKKLIITNLRNKTWTTYYVWKIFGIPTNYMGSVLSRQSWDYLLND